MVTLRSNRVAAWPVVLLAAIAAGCGVEKSENPLSPSVAGPIAGVEISAPRASEPAPGAKLKASQQPLRLMVENANSNGVRPLSYTFEVASDSAFQNKVFARSSVTPGHERQDDPSRSTRCPSARPITGGPGPKTAPTPAPT